jgi:deoxyribonuclease-4
MRPSFEKMYVHASYLIDLAGQNDIHPILHKELTLAQRVGVTHYILHPGRIDKKCDRAELLERVLRVLNNVMKQYPMITFCIENTANPSTLLGGTMEDFLYVQDRIEMPERLGFCIDTAHAHAAGYDFKNNTELLHGIDTLIARRCMLSLIHFNDTQEKCGSRIDRHEIPGRGAIGKELLSLFVNDPRLKDIPLIIEPPSHFTSFSQMNELIDELISEW